MCIRDRQYATAIYQAELMHQIRQLGYTLETGKSGAPEIKGYSKEYLQASSPRREQIEEYLKTNGLSGPAAAANAAQNTRDKKQPMTQEEILAAHKELAATYGNQADKVVSEAVRNHALQTAGHAVGLSLIHICRESTEDFCSPANIRPNPAKDCRMDGQPGRD